MKILTLTHTCPRFHGDSAAPFMQGLGNGFTDIGDQQLMLAPYDPLLRTNDPHFKYELLFYRYAPFDRAHVLGYSRMLKNDMGIRPATLILGPLMIWHAIRAAERLVRERGVQILHAHWIVPNGYIGAVVSRRTGVPLIVTLPGSDVYMSQKHRVFRYLARAAFQQARLITTNSPELGKDLIGLGADPKKIRHVIYGVDANRFKPSAQIGRALKQRLKLSAEKITIVSVGRLVEKKGFHILLNALALLKPQHKAIQVLIVGDGAAREKLTRQAQSLGLAGIVTFVGQQPYDTLDQWYNAADIFVLPSIRDRGGNLDDQSVALVEAMSCAKPVITSNLPGYRLVVEDGAQGLLTPLGNVRALSEALKTLITKSALRQKMAHSARARVEKECTWPAIARIYHTLFESVIKPNA